MLMRTDPFRELDRLAQQSLGGNPRLPILQMDAWRDGEQLFVEFDLPGVSADAIELDVERNVLTVRAQRPARTGGQELLAAERARGVFTRHLILGDNLDTERISATCDAGVLKLQIPVAEKSKPRKITIHNTESLSTESLGTEPLGAGSFSAEDERQLLNA
jgi:HSP20 family protein